MALITWNESYSVEIEEIDIQHQKLVNILNQLFEMMRNGEGATIVGPILDDLVDYTKVHFGTEEKYFDEFSYSGTAVHKAQHVGFVKKVSEFQERFHSGEVSLSIELMNFLKEWLVGHIQGTDRKYIDCFHEHGLK